MSLTLKQSGELWLLIVSALNARGFAAVGGATPEQQAERDAAYSSAVDALLAKLKALEVES